jgi:4a-hydroxytetrahydrobiopterin dehydratase
MSELSEQHCRALTSNSPALSKEDSEKYLVQLNNDWGLSADGKTISRTFKFSNYYEAMAFANVAAMVAHQQNHHPDMTVSYNRCHIAYSTHSINGLSIHDFICAAKTDDVICL